MFPSCCSISVLTLHEHLAVLPSSAAPGLYQAGRHQGTRTIGPLRHAGPEFIGLHVIAWHIISVIYNHLVMAFSMADAQPFILSRVEGGETLAAEPALHPFGRRRRLKVAPEPTLPTKWSLFSPA